MCYESICRGVCTDVMCQACLVPAGVAGRIGRRSSRSVGAVGSGTAHNTLVRCQLTQMYKAQLPL